MKSPWAIAALGGTAGACAAFAVTLIMNHSGPLPGSNDDIRAYLMAHPDVIAAAEQKAQSDQEASEDAERQRAVDKLGAKAFFDPRFAFIEGPANAKRTVVEFFDYNCPYCRASIPAMKKFYDAHRSDTRFAFIEFPFKGPQSTLAARAALAARRQPDKYVEFHFALMSEDSLVDADTIATDARKVGLNLPRLENDMRAPDIDAEIAQSHALADAAKIDATPAFIVNGKVHEGEVDEDILRQMAKS